MGISYYIRCKKCQEAKEVLHELEKWDLADNLDADFWLDWGDINTEGLIRWIETHKEHGKFEFTGE